MPRQVSDEEWQYLQSRKTTADFVESIYNDPALNREAKALIKKKYPNLSIPDYDLENKVEQRFAAEQKKRDDNIAANRQRAQDERLKKLRTETQKKYGFTDEAMGDLEKLMLEKNIGDYEVAAHYKAARDPKPVEAQFQQHAWSHGKTDEFKKIAADPEEWARGEILGAVTRDMQRMKQQTF